MSSMRFGLIHNNAVLTDRSKMKNISCCITRFIICFCALSWSLADDVPVAEPPKQYEPINITDCPDYGKPKQHFQAPVFSADTENLSFENCGSWQPDKDFAKAPWLTQLVDSNNTLIDCDGILISEKTIISDWMCTRIYETFKNGTDIQIHGGPCGNDDDLDTCYRFHYVDKGKGLGLLVGAKVLHVDFLLLADRPFVYVWTVTPLKLSDNLKPICLWNEDNSKDEQLHYIIQDDFGFIADMSTSSNHSKVEQSISESLVPKQFCDILRNIIFMRIYNSHDHLFRLKYLLVKKGAHFYFRGLIAYNSKNEHAWIDILFQIRKVINFSSDLAMMPAIPLSKLKHDFGTKESFENCGISRNDVLLMDEVPCPSNDSAIQGHDPWHASLTLHFGSDPKNNFCGATLISTKALLTAAHCLFDERGEKLSPSEVEIHLGVHDIHDQAENFRQNLKAASVLIHPGYNHSSGSKRHDLALVIVNENEINVTHSVRPICLWNDIYDFSHIANRTGRVVGRALTNGQNARYLQKFDLRLAPFVECFSSNRAFFATHLYPTENLCVKDNSLSINEKGVGLVLLNSATQRHFLRGVLSQRVEGGYTLFTDITNYIKWIVDNI